MAFEFTQESLELLKRPELQQLAKKHGIKANQKSEALRSELAALILQSAQQDGTSAGQAPLDDETRQDDDPENTAVSNSETESQTPKIDTAVVPMDCSARDHDTAFSSSTAPSTINDTLILSPSQSSCSSSSSFSSSASLFDPAPAAPSASAKGPTQDSAKESVKESIMKEIHQKVANIMSSPAYASARKATIDKHALPPKPSSIRPPKPVAKNWDTIHQAQFDRMTGIDTYIHKKTAAADALLSSKPKTPLRSGNQPVKPSTPVSTKSAPTRPKTPASVSKLVSRPTVSTPSAPSLPKPNPKVSELSLPAAVPTENAASTQINTAKKTVAYKPYTGALKPLGSYKSNAAGALAPATAGQNTPSKSQPLAKDIKPVRTTDAEKRRSAVAQTQRDRRASSMASSRASLGCAL